MANLGAKTNKNDPTRAVPNIKGMDNILIVGSKKENITENSPLGTNDKAVLSLALKIIPNNISKIMNSGFFGILKGISWAKKKKNIPMENSFKEKTGVQWFL